MRAFYHPEQAAHDPLQSMRYGKIIPAKDLPVRTERLLGALKKHGISPATPEAHGSAAALTVHTPTYVAFLETIWQRWSLLPNHGPEVWPNYFPYWSGRPEDTSRPPCPAESVVGQVGWYLGDLSAPMGPHTWLSSLRSSETALSAAAAVVSGDKTAYALCRPSGHHARTDRAAGLCFLNNTAIAAQHLRRRFDKVAVLDIDVHHGDGTQQIFYNRDDVFTVSIHANPAKAYPYFTGYAHESGHAAGDGFNLNLPLEIGSDGSAMEAAVETALERIKAFGTEALVVAVGFDAHRDDPVGLLKLEAADFGVVARKVRALGLPTLAVQEGGYAIDAIGDCLDAFIGGLGA
jgi:acetoin utilization deacetylase AcuC-like enzyme